MPDISNQTLVISIQAVAAELRNLRAAIADGEMEPELLQSLEDHQSASDDLERAYELSARQVLNLPPYDELVGR